MLSGKGSERTTDPIGVTHAGRHSLSWIGESSRRSFVFTAGAIGAGAIVTGCSGGPDATEVSAGTRLGSLSDIPVGGGRLYLRGSIVVTQPTEGSYLGLSATCTHQGCTIREVNGAVIYCGCHGSEFDLEGNVINGPASKPLPEMAIEIRKDEVFTA